MNCTLERTPRTEDFIDLIDLPSITPVVEEAYATMPMAVVTQAYQTPDEEELYTSFEAAISERVSAMHGRLSRLSNQTPGIQKIINPTMSINNSDFGAIPQRQTGLLSFMRNRWIRYITLVALALGFVLLGFDLMGLLVLYAR